jgi:predicted nucleotidyltransferase
VRREQILDYLRELKKESMVKKLGLFGSYAKDNFDDYSDVDIVVQFNSSYLKTHDVWEYFDTINAIKHSIMERFHLKSDIFDLDSASPLKEQIQKDAIYV